MTRTTLFLKITDERGESSADAWSLEERRNKKKKKQGERTMNASGIQSRILPHLGSRLLITPSLRESGGVQKLIKKKIARMC